MYNDLSIPVSHFISSMFLLQLVSFCFFLGGEREESALTLLLEFSLFFFAGGMEESVLALLECNTTFTWLATWYTNIVDFVFFLQIFIYSYIFL